MGWLWRDARRTSSVMNSLEYRRLPPRECVASSLFDEPDPDAPSGYPDGGVTGQDCEQAAVLRAERPGLGRRGVKDPEVADRPADEGARSCGDAVREGSGFGSLTMIGRPALRARTAMPARSIGVRPRLSISILEDTA